MEVILEVILEVGKRKEGKLRAEMEVLKISNKLQLAQ